MAATLLLAGLALLLGRRQSASAERAQG
ncbi:MAG: hypothetical protein LC792_25295 [Actinobacteria bacterium]|nr:hypothetical protein [Actinomycetota bacterium]